MEESSGDGSNGEESHHSRSSNRSNTDDSLVEIEEGDDGEEVNSGVHHEDEDPLVYQYRFTNTPIPPPPPPQPLQWPGRGTLDDRISALPESLILHIFSFLSMKDVVKTGALSKRWRYLWTAVSTLVFQTPDVNRFNTCEFVNFVYEALDLCNSPKIEKFVLYFRYWHCFAPDVDAWISFATQNNVEVLELLFQFTPIESYRLPQHMYCNSSLKKLSLVNCVVMPSGVISWKSLKSLSMEGVQLADGGIAQILLGSPSLEFLELVCFRFSSLLDITSARLKRLVLKTIRSSGDPLLEISAPNLQSLEILGILDPLILRLRNVSSLIHANLNFRFTHEGMHDDFGSQNLLRELLESVQHVRELKIGSCCLEALSILEIKGVPCPSSSYKCLTLDTSVNKWDSPGIAKLLQSSPNIETLLVINTAFFDNLVRFRSKAVESYYSDGEKYRTLQKRFLECLLPHLETVKIVGFKEDDKEFKLPLIQWLLESASMLKKMEINAVQGTCYRSLKLRISEFPRSSPNAVISCNRSAEF